MADNPNNAPADEWLDVAAACRVVGGTRPINPATFYRGIKRGHYPAPEQRGANIKRVNAQRLAAALRRLSNPEPDAA